MADIKQAIEYAKKNPNTPFANELRRRIESGQMDKELQAAGISNKADSAASGFVAAIRDIPSDVKEAFAGARDAVATGLERADEARNQVENLEISPLSGTLKTIGSGLRAGAEVVGQGLIGAGKVFTSPEMEQKIGDKVTETATTIAQSDPIVKLIERYESLSDEQKATIDGTLGIAEGLTTMFGLGPTVRAIKTGVSTATDASLATARTAANSIKNTVSDTVSDLSVPTEVIEKVKSSVIPESSEIMNRVARLRPNDAKQFEQLAGKTHGEYLRETGNFGTPDQIIKNEAEKFSQSIQGVDDALSKLPGTFEDGSITDALAGLIERARSTSGANVQSPYLSRILELDAKHSSQGLTMSEINEVKRLYEKNVKLGYNKIVNGDKVEQATNIDNALREWQIAKAQELGFKNISNLNKQTQLSKFIVNKLGEQLVGQSGLNGVSLTDWIMLSGGDPAAVAGFLTKKFFSSKAVQSRIAKYLNRGKEVKGQIVPDLGPSQVRQLPAPKSSTRSSVGSDEVIRIAPSGNFEMTGSRGIVPRKK